MTEKRFTYENHKVKDNLTGEFHSSNRVSVNVLNSLNDENEQLKERIKELEQENGRMKGAFKRKFDYDIEDVVDEICDEDW